MVVLTSEYMHRFVLFANGNSFSLLVFMYFRCQYVSAMLEQSIQVYQSVLQVFLNWGAFSSYKLNSWYSIFYKNPWLFSFSFRFCQTYFHTNPLTSSYLILDLDILSYSGSLWLSRQAALSSSGTFQMCGKANKALPECFFKFLYIHM